jgi:hypothetical protein
VGDPFGVNLGERSYPIRFGADLRAVGRVAAAKRERGGAVFAADGTGSVTSRAWWWCAAGGDAKPGSALFSLGWLVSFLGPHSFAFTFWPGSLLGPEVAGARQVAKEWWRRNDRLFSFR